MHPEHQRGIAQHLGLVAGAAAFLLLVLADTPLAHHPEHGSRPAMAAAMAVLMAIWWLTEAVPMYWTACMPLLLIPLLRPFPGSFATNVEATLRAYLDPYIFLFAGGMAIAAAMQQWNLHRRIALSILAAIGTDPKRLLAGLLAATAFVSLWISNTATAAMMLPIGLALISQIEAHHGGRRLASYGMALMLAIAYGSNVGGIGTKIGTAPNAQLAGFLDQLGRPISFGQFLLIGLPFVLLFLPIVWWRLWRLGRRDGLTGEIGAGVIRSELAALGRVRPAETTILAVFLVTAALWIFGKNVVGLLRTAAPTWNLSTAHIEGGIAMAAALVLLVWRRERRQVLELRSLKAVPWETLLLLGGGFAMAAAIQASGLSGQMAAGLAGLRELSPFMQVLVASTAAVALSAVASNTATIAVLLVVLKEAVAPEMLTTVLFAATIGCSCDFALPAGTPPNAIVFGSGYVSIPKMARLGALLDLAAALLAALWCWLIVRAVLGG